MRIRLGFTLATLLVPTFLVVGLLSTARADDPVRPAGKIADALNAAVVQQYAIAPGYSEGPTWRNGELFFCSGGLLRVTPDRRVRTFFDIGPAGTYLLADGSMLICDNKQRALLRMDADNRLSVVADACDGEPLKSLNDVTVDAQGNAYWSDPSGSSAQNPIGSVYRVTPQGKVSRVAGGMAFPNGLDVDPNSRFLYVIESQTQKILRFALPQGDADFGKPEEFYNLGGSGGDGCTFDADGNLWVADFHRRESTGRGRITVLNPQGQPLGYLDIPAKVVSNITFGGAEHDEIFCTTGNPPGVFHAKVGIKGFRGHPGKPFEGARELATRPNASLAALPAEACVFSGATTAPLGWLAKKSHWSTALEADDRITALFGRLSAQMPGDDVKPAIAAWEAITGPPTVTQSGRPGLQPVSPQSLSRKWIDCNLRLLQLTGQSRFGDALEAALYTSAWEESAPWDVATDSIIGTMQTGGTPVLALNLFETTSAAVPLGDNRVTVHVVSEYPRAGKVQLNFRMDRPATFGLWVRVPNWCEEIVLRYLDLQGEAIGRSGDWARLPAREWKNADWIEITFAMQPARRHTAAAPRSQAPAPRSQAPAWERGTPWGPLELPGDPATDNALAKKLDSGTPFQLALNDLTFPPPVARPSKPAQPGEPLQPGKMFLPTGERRMFGVWLDFNPDNWTGVIGSDPPGQRWPVKVLPYATFIHRRVYGSRPHDYAKGERVNVFLRAGENGEWAYVSNVQDELMQMFGHGHWWLVRQANVGGDPRLFTARTYAAGTNLADADERTFRIDDDCGLWRDGQPADSFPLAPGDRVRMMWVYRDGQPCVRLLANDASLDAIRDASANANERWILTEGIAGFVDRIDGETAHLTLFSNFWPYCHRLLPESKVQVTATDDGYRPAGEAVEMTLVSAKVGGQYGSGPTAALLRGNTEPLKTWAGAGKVIRLVPAKLR